MARVFISHASADLAAAVEIRLWLRDAGHEVFLDRDLGEGIQIGEEWKRRLYRELREADAIVCVVTDDYRMSEWCSAEVGIADMLGCPLLPVRAVADARSPLFDGLQYADLVGEPDRARTELTRRLELIDAAGGSAWPDDRSPYPGLRPFEADMARVFRGRSVETRQLGRQLRSLGDRARGGLLVVVGPSGSGKSSLVRAGLVPAVAAEPDWEVAAPFTPGTDPVAELARALAITANRSDAGWGIPAVADRLTAIGGVTGVAEDLLIRGRREPRERLLLVIDQGEELLTRSTPDALATFCRLLSDGLAGPVRAVLTLRSEFLDRLRAVPDLATVEIDPFVLRPLDGAMLRAIVQEPATVAGLHIETELVDRLVADTPGGEALPLLAFSLAELARGKSRGDSLTADAYADLGGVAGALGRHADEALTEAAESSGLSPAVVVDGLTRLATLDETDQPTRRRLPTAGLEPELLVAFETFVENRLLVTTAEADGTWIGVAHEALLRAWPPLADAIESRRAALRELRTIETAASEWTNASADQAAAYLWDNDRLTAAQVALDLGDAVEALTTHPDLDPVARRFLTASTDQAQRARRTTRRRRITTVTTLSILLAISIFLGAVAAIQRNQEQSRADEAKRALIAQDLLARSDLARNSDRPLALRLALSAGAVSPSTSGTDASLIETLGTPRPVGEPLAGPTVRISTLAVSADGHVLAAGSDDGFVRLWAMANIDHPSTSAAFDNELGEVLSLAISPDGKVLAVGAADGVRLWEIGDPTDPQPRGAPLAGHAGMVLSVAFSPHGRILASGSSDRTIRLWDVADPAAASSLGAPLTGHSGWVSTLSFSSNGRTLASGAGDGAIQLWDVSDPLDAGLRDRLTDAGGSVTSVAFAVDGTTLASCDGFSVVLWDTTDPTNARQIGQPLAVDALTLSFSPDGHTLAAGSPDIKPQLWEVADPAHPLRLGEVTTSAAHDTAAMVFAPDGRRLAIGSSDGTVRLWDTRNPAMGAVADPLTGHTDDVRSVMFSSDGRTLITTSSDVVRSWEVGEPDDQGRRRVTPASPPTGDRSPIELSGPQTVVLAAPGPTDLPPGEPDVPPERPTPQRSDLDTSSGFVGTMVYSPNRRVLAAVYSLPGPPVLRVWDTTDPEAPRQIGDVLAGDPDEEVASLTFSPDSHVLAVGYASVSGGRPTLRLWDVSDPDRLRFEGDPLTDDHGGLVSVAFAPDRLTIATGSQPADGSPGRIQLWDVSDTARPRPIGAPLVAGRGEVTSLGFSPDGTVLAAGLSRAAERGGVVRLWDAAGLIRLRDDLVNPACAQAGGFSESDWDELVPAFPFPDPCGAGRSSG